MSTGKSSGLDRDGADTEELGEDHKEELKMGLAELQGEQQEELAEEHCSEQEEDSNNAIKPTMEKQSKYHPDITAISRMLDLTTDNMVYYF